MSYDSVVLADSPTAYFKMQDTSGTTLVDSSGNSTVGSTTATGVTRSGAGAILSDPNSRTMAFDGTNGYWTATINFSAGHIFTFECWASIPSLGASPQALLEIPVGGFSSAAGGALIQWDSSSASWQQFVQAWAPTSGAQSTSGYQSTNPTIGVLHHLVFIWDYAQTGPVAQMKLYVDGVAQTGTAVVTNNATQNVVNGVFTIFALGSGGSKRAGSMGNAAFYSTALSAAQVLAHYAAAFPSPPRIRRSPQAAMRAATW